MAKFDYGRQIEYCIRFSIDKTALTQLQTELNKIQSMGFNTIQMKMNTADLEKARQAYYDIKSEAKQLQDVLDKTFNNSWNLYLFSF